MCVYTQLYIYIYRERERDRYIYVCEPGHSHPAGESSPPHDLMPRHYFETSSKCSDELTIN